MSSDGMRRRLAHHYARLADRKATRIVFTCDVCKTATFEGTNAERHAAGWRKRKHRVPGTGVREMVDICPACRDAERRK